VGDSVRIGRALITLTGLLDPAADDEPVVSAPAASGWEPTFEPDPEPAPRPEPAAQAKSLPAPLVTATASSAPAGFAPPPAPPPAPKKSARWTQAESFEDELVAALKRAPWFALSAAIHAAIFALLLIFGPSEAKKPPSPPEGVITASAFDAADLGGPRDAPDPAKPPEESAA